MSDRRMQAYYYSFTPTGVEVIDKVLGAVACAGKAFHHTEYWCDEAGPRDDHTGEAPVDWIQNAAKEAAARIEALEAEKAEQVQWVKDLADMQIKAEARIEALEAENMRLRQHIASTANNINVAGSPYDKAMTALEDLMRSIKSGSRAALEDKP